VGQLYYFLHYTSSQISNFKASDMRLTDLSYTTTILPTMTLTFYLPHYISHLHPSLPTRHAANWIWQLFPLWTALAQQLLKRTHIAPDTVQHDRMHNPRRDWGIIRATVGTCVALSTGVWMHTIAMSPFSLAEIFIPHFAAPGAGVDDWMLILRTFVQYDHLFCFGGALLWLGWLFTDLKAAGMVLQSWIRIIMMAVVTTLVFGPGAAVGLGWLWREHVLVHRRHKGAVVRGWEGDKTKVMNGHAEKKERGIKESVANGYAI
jgi:hypothetical protein